MPERYNFPKVELHCHLDGCPRLETVVDIAKKRGMSLPSYDPKDLNDFIRVQNRGTLKTYLDKMQNLIPIIAGDEEALVRITKEAVEDRKRDGVAYVELRYSPHIFANCDVEDSFFEKEKGRLRPRDVVEIINKAVREAEQEFNTKVRTVLCDIVECQHWGLETAQLCREYASQGVVGFDISCIQGVANYHEGSAKAFEYCRYHGIHRTAHAGEMGDANQVRVAVEQMGAERIGHGYHVVDDEEVYKFCKDRGTHFEVCPWSSFLTGSVPEDWKQHPATKFLHDDVNFSLNTDCPNLQLSDLHVDYDIAEKYWGFTEKDLQKLNLNAAQSSFLDASDRVELVNELKRAYEEINEAHEFSP